MSAPIDDEPELARTFSTLEPSPAAVVRMGEAIEGRLARLARPLWREWLGLFRARPVLSPGLALAAMAMVVVTTPMGLALGLGARAVLSVSFEARGSSREWVAAWGMRTTSTSTIPSKSPAASPSPGCRQGAT